MKYDFTYLEDLPSQAEILEGCALERVVTPLIEENCLQVTTLERKGSGLFSSDPTQPILS